VGSIGMTNVRSWKQISKLAATLGGQSELWAAVSTKAVWWDLRLASLLTHLFFKSHHTVVWGRYLVYCAFVCLFFFVFFVLFVCTVADFSAVEKARGVKLCTGVSLLSGQVFSPFGEDWFAGSHGGGGITSR